MQYCLFKKRHRNKINLHDKIYTPNDISANSSTLVFNFNVLLFKFSSYVLTLANDSNA